MLFEGDWLIVVEEFELGLAVVKNLEERAAICSMRWGVARRGRVFALHVLDGFNEVGDVWAIFSRMRAET